MYTPRTLFSPNLQNFRSFSLYPPLRNKCPISYHMRQQIIESEGKVWSVCIHKVHWIMCFRDMVVRIFLMVSSCQDFSEPEIAQFYPSLPKTQLRTKHEVDRITRCWDMAIWSFQNGRRSPSWIWSNRKWYRSIRRSQYPTWRGSVEALHSYGHLNFLHNVLIGPEVGRSVVGRQYSYFLHWSHILLFRYVARGVKNNTAFHWSETIIIRKPCWSKDKRFVAYHHWHQT